MKYLIEVAGRALEVEVDQGRVLVDGRPVEARLTGRPGEVVRALARGPQSRLFQATRGERRGEWVLTADGSRLAATVLDQRDRAIRKAAGGGAAGQRAGTLKAPMPGMVVRVLIDEGAQVVAGQGLVVVEAMKMENELKAPGPGLVRKVHVTPGSRVEKGSRLVDLE